MTYVLQLPEPTPSRNQFHHKHWRVEHTAKKRWGKMIAIAAMHARTLPAIGKRRVRVDRYGMRRLDEDNFIGGLKGILDSMRELGLLVDDNAASLELLCRQLRPEPRQKPFTVITIEDIT